MRKAGRPGWKDLDAGRGLHFDTSILAFEVAANLQGVAIGRMSLARQLLKDGRLVAPFDISVPTEESFFLLKARNKHIHPDAEIFRQWILSTVEKPD